MARLLAIENTRVCGSEEGETEAPAAKRPRKDLLLAVSKPSQRTHPPPSLLDLGS